ncbi:MAG TPA: TRAM domain-containing protein [Gemmatimonadaceae bacterium]|nr:TRAM domain-containing protein [Gemmatimonadaceae bacterium]
MTETLTLDIEAIAAGGDGVARHDGLVVFVPRTVPGDRVVARVTRQRKFGRGQLERIERAGASRVEPRCRHYTVDDCGGCQLQHLDLAAQRAAKVAVVHDALRRIGRRQVAPPVMHAAPAAWRYRQRIAVAVRRRGDARYGGFHCATDPHRVFDLEDCLIADEAVMDLWRSVRAAAGHLPPGDALRVSVRVAGAERAVLVEGGAAAWTDAAAFVAALPPGTGVWWAPDAGRRRRVDGGTDAFAGASFAQVNPAVAGALRQCVVAHVTSRAPRTALDAYAGAGDVAEALQAAGIAVTAVEMDEDAAAAAARRLHAPSRAIAARVEDVLARLLPADVVVVNPPRTGLAESVAHAMESAARPGAALVYVSCDPATLGRDLARMPSWSVARLDAFDMFPQTAHVETVALLVPGAVA